jgi:hypothetical protein
VRLVGLRINGRKTCSGFESGDIFCLTVLMISAVAAESRSRAAQMADALDSKVAGSFTIIGIRSWKSRATVVASGCFVFGASGGSVAVVWSAVVAALDGRVVAAVVVAFDGPFGGVSYGLARLDISRMY